MAPLLTLMIAVVSLLVTIALHLLIAMVVYTDANRVDTRQFELQISPALWTLAALIGGVTVLALYWVMYHSTLRRDRS